MNRAGKCLLCSLLCVSALADIARSHDAVDNQFFFSRNASSPPTLSKRVIDSTNRGVYGLSPTDTIILAESSVNGGTISGKPDLTFAEVGATGDTITRANGSWISDGFAVGQAIYVTGTDNNNISRAMLTNVTATILTLDGTDLAAEGGTNGGTLSGSPNLTFAEVSDYGDTITRASGSWITDGFKVGQLVTVTGSSSNNVTDAYIADVTATKITLGATDLAAEGPVGGVTVTSRIAVKGSDRFVTVENFGSGTITDNRRANVSNITINGNQSVPVVPHSNPTELNLSPFGSTYTADGIALDGQFPTVQNVQVFNCRGVGVAHRTPDGRLFDSEIHECHTGVRVPSSDMEVRRCRIFDCRDACLFLTRDSGNIQSTDNHCYGARIACYNEGAFPYRATGDTYADSWIGYFGSVYGIQTVLSNVLFQHNTVRDCVFSNYGCSLQGCIVEVQRDVQTNNQLTSPTALVPTYADKKVGVELGGGNCSILGGMVELTNWWHPAHTPTGNAAEAIWVKGDGCVIETQLVDLDSVNGSIGIRVKGTRKALKIDCTTGGFHESNDRILVVDDAPNCDGLDITIRAMGVSGKSVDNYIDIGSGWTGSIRFIDVSTGTVTTLTEGSAH